MKIKILFIVFLITSLVKLSFGQTNCNVLTSDVFKPGHALYVKRAYFSDNDTILVIRDITALPERYSDPANWASSSTDNSPYAPITKAWIRAQFEGNDLMGLTFDPRTREMYASTSILFNESMSNQPLSTNLESKVYRVSADGNSVDVLATLPGNKGTGWLSMDTMHNQIYVSNFDDGLIYVIPLSGGINQTGPFNTYSFYPPDDLNESTTPSAPDWNMAPLGQRIFSVSFNAAESRLYYSIWSNDIGSSNFPPPNASLNFIRSVEVDNMGNFIPSTDIVEITVPGLHIGQYNNPASDIEFSADGKRLILAEQGLGSLEGLSGFAHNSRILEYKGNTGAWIAEPIAKFSIGTCCGGPGNHSGTDSRGGIAFAPGAVFNGNSIGPEDFLIATADAVADDYNLPDHARYVDGAGLMPSYGSYSSNKVLGIDLDEIRIFPGKGSYGDIEVLSCPLPAEPFDLALTKTIHPDYPAGPYTNGSVAYFKIRLYNQGTQPVQNITVRDYFPPTLVLSDPNWTNPSPGVAERIHTSVIQPGMFSDLDISFTINSSSSTSIINYGEIVSLHDISNNPVSDSDSDGTLGAGNDPNEIDNYIYGINSNQDIDDLDLATLWVGTVGIGNLVFKDNNSNGIYNSGEGIDNVKIYLFRPGYGKDGMNGTPDDGMPVDSVDTDPFGEYSFTGLAPGQYFVQIPYFEFLSGGDLVGYTSITGNGADNSVDDDLDENGLDKNGIDIGPATQMGVSSNLITLLPGQESNSENGFNGGSDNPDNDIDYTVDFGFEKSLGIGNLVWIDLDNDNQYDLDEGVENVSLNLYRPGYGPDGIPGNTDDDQIVKTTTTNSSGNYYFEKLADGGQYYVEIPASAFNPSTILINATSLPGDGSDNGMDDDVDENGIDNGLPSINGVRSALITIQRGTEPTTTETGSNTNYDEGNDDDFDLTIDFGFKPTVGIGNAVWIDNNNNGVFDSGEGVNNVLVELYQPGVGPDKIPGNSDDNDIINTFLTLDIGLGAGLYYFAVQPGIFRVHIPASNFQFGGPLYGYMSINSNGGDNDIDDNLDENGINDNSPASNGISSGLINLAYNSEPINEPGFANLGVGPLDSYLNFTVDFGFFFSPCNISSVTAIPGACNPANNQYSLTGQVTFTNPPSTGTLTVQITGGGSQVFNAPFTSPQSYSIAGQTSDGASHTVTATFSADGTCTSNTTYTAPASCMVTCSLTSAGKTNETCNNNGTLSNGADDYITFSLNPTGTGLGTGYTVSASGGATVTPTSGTYGSATNFQLQNGSANGTTYTITVTDNATGACQVTTTVMKTSCSTCPTPDCLYFQVIKNNN